MTNSTARLLSPSLLSWLRCFDATARHVSFTRAAEDLCVTQGAVSQQVKQLEQWLGRRLLLRSPRALALTPEGQRLARVLRESLQAIESTLVDLRQVNDAQPVTMSCAPSFAMAWLTPRLGSFFQKHPQIGLRVQAEFHALDRSRMLNDGVDAVVEHAAAVQRVELGLHAQADLRMLLEETAQPGREPGHRERRRAAHRHRLGVVHLPQIDQRAFYGLQRFAQHPRQPLPLGRQRQRARRAQQQAPPQPLLQLFDLLAHRTLGHAQIFRGAGEADMPRRGVKAAQPGQQRRR